MKTLFQFFSLFLAFAYSLSLTILPVRAQAANATFVLSPSSRSVVINTTFEVKINMRASGTKQVSYGRAILAFDPTRLEIAQAIEHSQLFCNYPTDANNYYANNAEGAIMITGIATGTQSCAYPTLTTSDSLFAKVVFKAKKTGTAEVSFVYNGQQNDNYSGILDINSPTQFIMTTPQDGVYTITSGGTPTPTPTVPPNLGVDPRVAMLGIAGMSVLGWAIFSRRQQSGQRVVTTG